MGIKPDFELQHQDVVFGKDDEPGILTVIYFCPNSGPMGRRPFSAPVLSIVM